jgi:hypothetical protein
MQTLSSTRKDSYPGSAVVRARLVTTLLALSFVGSIHKMSFNDEELRCLLNSRRNRARRCWPRASLTQRKRESDSPARLLMLVLMSASSP